MSEARLVPGEDLLFELDRPKLVALEQRGSDASGERTSERRYQFVAEGHRMLVTNVRLLTLDREGVLLHEAIYDLPFLRTCLAVLRRRNDAALAGIAQAEEGEGAVGKWLHSRHDAVKFGLVDSVHIVAWAERPRGVIGPKPYALLTLCSFRPVSAEKQEGLEARETSAAGSLGKAKLEIESRRVGRVFSFSPVRLSFHPKDRIDELVATLDAKTSPMTQYLSGPQGLEADYGLPSGTGQGLRTYRPPDFEAP